MSAVRSMKGNQKESKLTLKGLDVHEMVVV